MSNAWDNMKESGGGGGANFVKLKSGESVEGVFMGDPYVFYAVFKEKAEYSSWAEGRSKKFRINFITKDEKGNYVAKIYQGGSKIAKAIAACREEYGLDGVLYKIKRDGSTKDDTTYSVLFKKELTKAQMDTLRTVALLPLTSQKSEFEVAQEVLGGEVIDVDVEEDPFS